MTKIELSHVSFAYNPEEPVLKDISMTFEEPGLYCILGPNGVGKSTVVKCICKINEHTEGDIFIDGQNTKELRYKDIAKVVSFVPATSNEMFSMSVIDTIMIGRYNKRKWGQEEEDLRQVYKAMNLLHIENLAYHKSNQLSAGQHQKVSLARGLVQEPKVLILDEPTANLDVKYQVYVTELLRAIAKQNQMIIIMISHDLNITAKYADRIIMMARPGVVYTVGTPEEVITSENIEHVYGIKSTIIKDPNVGVPVVILGESLMDNE
ncbi:MAG: ABC transporter ATP-binding protein [archaeon]|nr:ABC transporter ATP-binding protein [archaeon]